MWNRKDKKSALVIRHTYQTSSIGTGVHQGQVPNRTPEDREWGGGKNEGAFDVFFVSFRPPHQYLYADLAWVSKIIELWFIIPSVLRGYVCEPFSLWCCFALLLFPFNFSSFEFCLRFFLKTHSQRFFLVSYLFLTFWLLTFDFWLLGVSPTRILRSRDWVQIPPPFIAYIAFMWEITMTMLSMYFLRKNSPLRSGDAVSFFLLLQSQYILDYPPKTTDQMCSASYFSFFPTPFFWKKLSQNSTKIDSTQLIFHCWGFEPAWTSTCFKITYLLCPNDPRFFSFLFPVVQKEPSNFPRRLHKTAPLWNSKEICRKRKYTVDGRTNRRSDDVVIGVPVESPFLSPLIALCPQR